MPFVEAPPTVKRPDDSVTAFAVAEHYTAQRKHLAGRVLHIVQQIEAFDYTRDPQHMEEYEKLLRAALAELRDVITHERDNYAVLHGAAVYA